MYTHEGNLELEARIGAELEALKQRGFPAALGALYLGGGYGRGEGGSYRDPAAGALRPYNDMDFFAWPRPDSNPRMWPAADRQLAQSLEILGKNLGIEADGTPLKPFAQAQRQASRLMYQELRAHHVLLYSADGYDPVATLPLQLPGQLPILEGARLLMNRGFGLLLAHERLDEASQNGFLLRNFAKAAQGGGDALLIRFHRYLWNAEERAAAFRTLAAEQHWPSAWADDYDRALAFKFAPKEAVPPEGWRQAWDGARTRWNAEYEAFLAPSGDPRQFCGHSLRNLARWILRAHTLPRPGYWTADPVAALLPALHSALNAEQFPPRLRRWWELFN